MNARLSLTVAAAVLLSACAVGPDYVAPDAPTTPAAYARVEGGDWAQTDAPLLSFWEAFDDPVLDRLVQDALAANRDLRIAIARIDEARALRGEARLDQLPTVQANAGYQEALASADEAPGLDREARRSSLYRGSFDAFWELDLYGRVRRNVEAASASEQALRADLADLRTSLAADVASTYFELRGAQARLAVAQSNARNQQDTLAYAQARLDAGSGTDFDVYRARSQLDATRATLPQFQAAETAAMHRLAVLGGRTPEALLTGLGTPADMPPLPRVTRVGAPADLLRRRADIRAAERRLAASTARIGVATADLFPQVSIGGSVGFAVDVLGDAGSGVGETWSYGPGIHWAAFDLGRGRARIAQTEAQRDGALANYEQTVLRALEETATALDAYGHSRERLEHLARSRDDSVAAARLAHVRFDGGVSDFLDVLDAERAQLAAEDAYAQARRDAGNGLVALYRALGGGWQEDPLLAAN